MSAEDFVPGTTMRPMAHGDVTAVASMEASTFTTPWKEDTFRSLLERPGVELWVAELDGEVAAYAILWCILEEGEQFRVVAVRVQILKRMIESQLSAVDPEKLPRDADTRFRQGAVNSCNRLRQ